MSHPVSSVSKPSQTVVHCGNLLVHISKDHGLNRPCYLFWRVSIAMKKIRWSFPHRFWSTEKVSSSRGQHAAHLWSWNQNASAVCCQSVWDSLRAVLCCPGCRAQNHQKHCRPVLLGLGQRRALWRAWLQFSSRALQPSS